MHQKGEIIAGKYELVEKIGEGGYGEVWKARHRILGTLAAVKFLKPERYQDAARLLREAAIAFDVQHPHIVEVLEVDQEARAIVMEFVEGGDLRQWVAQNKPSREQILSLLQQVATALDHIHEHGLVHGDVKPANILVANTLKGPVAKLADFGLAGKGADLRGGSLNYLAPEQLERLNFPEKEVTVDSRADQYALGVVAYELLVGALPYPEVADPTIAFNRRRDPPPEPSSHNRDLPPSFDRPLMRALSVRREARFPSCGAFLAALHHADRQAREDLARDLQKEVYEALRQGDVGQAEEGLNKIERYVGGLSTEHQGLRLYTEMLAAWQQAQAKAEEVLRQVPSFQDNKQVLLALEKRHLPFWTWPRLRPLLIQVGVGAALALPFALLFFVLALRAIAY